MKYEFHVGDYVETVGGFIGWVYKVRDDGYIWVTNKDTTSFNSCNYRMPEELKYFKRIGQYDFTKKDAGKIKPLEYNGSPDWDDSLLLDKINELVEAVNRLEEKVNGN